MNNDIKLNKSIEGLSVEEKDRLIKVQHGLLEKILLFPEKVTFLELMSLKNSFGKDIMLPIERESEGNREMLLEMLEDLGLDVMPK